MVNKIKANTNRLGTDADRIQTYTANIAKEIEAMEQDVGVLMQMWDGPSSEAFHKAFQDDMRAMETVMKNLKGIYHYDTNAKKEYEACERKVSSMIAEIKV